MHRGAYYKSRLSAEKLLRCYEIASPRIKQYLEAEIQFVVSNVQGVGLVLELGCGYGRVLKSVAPFVSMIAGCDVSRSSLEFAAAYMKPCRNYVLVLADASDMGFANRVFDAVFCVQNGISAFGVAVCYCSPVIRLRFGASELSGLGGSLKLVLWGSWMRRRRVTGR